MLESAEPQDSELKTVDPGYWLNVCGARQAIKACLGSSGQLSIFADYPILVLPELPEAARTLVTNTPDPEFARAYWALGKMLENAQAALRESGGGWYAKVTARCAVEIADEKAGDRRVNYQRAAQLFRAARSMFEPGSPEFSRCLMSEAEIRMFLANRGAEPRANLETAIRLCEQRRAMSQTGVDYVPTLKTEATMRTTLAELGVDPHTHLQIAVDLYERIRTVGGEESFSAEDLVGEADTRQKLATLSVDAAANLIRASQLFGKAAELLTGDDQAMCIRWRASVHEQLADLGIESERL